MITYPITKSQVVAQSARGPFLLLPPVCIFAGVASALVSSVDVDIVTIVLMLLLGVLAHISVNLFNEHHDFKSGLDFNTRRTPFSGGSGSLLRSGDALPWVFAAAIGSLILMILIGVYFIATVGWKVAPIGMVGVLLIVLYSGPINRSPLLCLIAPGLGFGILMVGGAHLLLVGSVSLGGYAAAFLVFFLTNNLLLLNQFPDISADKMAGRNHALIAWGTKRSAQIFLGFWLASIAVIVMAVAVKALPTLALLALLGLLPGAISVFGAFKYGEQLVDCPGYLATNVLCVLLSPLLLGVGILLAH